ALETMAALRACERDRDAARSDGDAHLERLKAALDTAGTPYAPEAGFEQLMAVAQASVDQASEIRQLRREFDERQRDLAERERILARCSTEDQNWNSEWLAACSSSWLGEAGARSVSEIGEILTAVSDLGALI